MCGDIELNSIFMPYGRRLAIKTIKDCVGNIHTMLRGRPEERFKFAMGVIIGATIAVPVNIIHLTNLQETPELGYALLIVAIAGILFRNRSAILGATGTILIVSVPQAAAAVLPTPLSGWHISTGLVWLIAAAILGCLYIIRGAETRTDADIDPYWLFKPRQ